MNLLRLVMLPTLAICTLLGGAAMVVGQVFPHPALYFIASSDNHNRIYAMDPTRGITRKLSDIEVSFDSLLVSPDGRHIAFTAVTGNLMTATYLMDWNGANVRALPVSEARDVAWSPDSEYLAYWAYGDIYIIPRDGTNPMRITNSDSEERNPVWSPDGRQVAFVSRSWRDSRFRLYAARTDELQPRCLANFPVYTNGIGTTVFTEDGTQVASVTDHNGRLTVFLTEAEGKVEPEECPTPTEVIDQPAFNTYSILWSPDYRHIAFTSNQGGQWGIFIVPTSCLGQVVACSESRKRVSQANGDAGYPSWSPDGEQLAYIVGLNRRPQIWLTDLEGNARPLTRNRYSYWSPVWWR